MKQRHRKHVVYRCFAYRFKRLGIRCARLDWERNRAHLKYAPDPEFGVLQGSEAWSYLNGSGRL